LEDHKGLLRLVWHFKTTDRWICMSEFGNNAFMGKKDKPLVQAGICNAFLHSRANFGYPSKA
jgi:hypothetical protein